eukprot:9099938-Pyramimonas_sp.AAC.1
MTYKRWGRPLGNVPRTPQTPEGSSSGEGGDDIHGRSTIRVPPAARPWTPCLRVPYPMPPPQWKRRPYQQ